MKGKSHTGGMTPSKENYLKVMLELSGEGGIRSIDIGNALGISKASVSRMMSILKDEGYVTKEKYGTVTLTDSGIRLAANVKRRYELINTLLKRVLGVEAATAARDACRIEHLISSETADKIDLRLEKLAECS